MKLTPAKGNMYPFCDSYHKLPDVGILAKLYYRDKLSLTEISKLFGATKGAVRLKLVRNGFRLRSLSEAQALKANYIELSESLTELLDGLLLGDGNIALREKSCCYQHTDKHYGYLEWLSDKLWSFGLEQSGRIRKCSRGYQFRTRYYRTLMKVRKRWYSIDGIKKIPEDLFLSPTVLKYWFISDGTFQAGKEGTKKGERLLIVLEFDVEGKIRLCKQLETLGIYCSSYRSGIYIWAKSRRKFYEYMLSEDSFIHPDYSYKFPKHYLGGR